MLTDNNNSTLLGEILKHTEQVLARHTERTNSLPMTDGEATINFDLTLMSRVQLGSGGD